MCRDCVTIVASISKTMNDYVKAKFEDAVFTDLNIFNDEADAMIALIMFEEEMEGINNAIASLNEKIKVDLLNSLKFAMGGI